jgi:phage recombination protein Bet
MSENQAVQQVKKISLVEAMSFEYGLDADKFVDIVKATVMPSNVQVSNAHIAAFLQVAHTYKLNPFFKEIYAFPSKSGGIQPIVSVDGWLAIANREPRYDGYEYLELRDDKGNLEGGQITIYLKDRQRPFVHREWFAECKRNTDPWNNMPRRMMQNRVTVQGLRRALGIHGIMDQDEADQMNEINITSQSTVLEKSTETKTEALKEKIGAKKTAAKANQAPEKEPDQPQEQTKPSDPVTTIEPAQEVVKELLSLEDKQAFMAAATEKATALGLDQDAAKKHLREILFNVGFTKLAEVTKDKFAGLMQEIADWK